MREITALVTQLKIYAGTDLHKEFGQATSGPTEIRKWDLGHHRVEQCFQILMDSADTYRCLL